MKTESQTWTVGSADSKWQAIISASRALLDAAQEERWDELSEQAAYRDRLIRDYFSEPITVKNALHIQEEIQRILAMDEQVLGMARRQQDGTSMALKNLRTGATAVKAYRRNQ